MLGERLCDSPQSGLCRKIGAHMVSQQDRGTFVDDTPAFPLPVAFCRVDRAASAGGGFEIELPMLHWWGTFDWIDKSGETRGNASVFAACAGERCESISANAAASLSRLHHDSNTREWRFPPGVRPRPSGGSSRISREPIYHLGVESGRRMMRGTRESTQHLLIIDGRTQEAFFPLVNPAH
jgi:hypothetical protein